jgi:hypothetical protein
MKEKLFQLALFIVEKIILDLIDDGKLNNSYKSEKKGVHTD